MPTTPRRRQQLIRKRARLRRMVVAVYLVIAGAGGVAWMVYARAMTDCSTAAPCVQSGTPLAGADWSLIFNDEFTGSTLDASKWNTGRWAPTTTGDEPYGAKKEGAYFTSSNVVQSGGAINIKLGSGRQTINGVTYHYASGELNTEHKFYLKPGDYAEARVKIPKCSGCWPAFWTIPTGKVPPEIDIYEFFNTLVRGRPSFNYHYDNGTETGVTPYGEPGADYRNSYHIYGFYWTGTTAIPFLDGKPYPVGLGPTTTQPEFMIFNLSTYAGTNPAPSELSIDWVRVWGPPEPVLASANPPAAAASNTPPDMAITTPTPAPTTAQPTQPSPTPRPAQAEDQTAVPIVSGEYTVPIAANAEDVHVSVDGTPTSSGIRINTRLLTNGQHTIAITATINSKTTKATRYILVNNRLNFFAWLRNQIFAPFHGNAALIVLANLLIIIVTGGGMAIMWYFYLPHNRLWATGLSI